MTLDSILTLALTSLASSGLAVFLLKKWIEHSFSARLASLEAENRIRAHEHQVRFTRFDEKLANAIEGAYGLVCDYAGAVVDIANKASMGTLEQKDTQGLDRIAEEFREFMLRQSIYLPLDLAAKLRETRGALRDAVQGELERSRARGEREAKGETISTVLVSHYSGAVAKEKCEAILRDLQEMVREHLSRFAQPQ